MNRNAKAEAVLDVALELLKDRGDYGVTMRQVATTAGMSLSNVQYYFKNKDELLKVMADRYFNACLDEMREMQVIRTPETASEDIRDMLNSFFSHGFEMTEMCRIFREYWAISTRNEVINSYIQQYYKQMALILSDLLRPAAKSEEGLSKAVSIIIPFVEGYSVAATAMPENLETTTDIMLEIVVGLLRK